MRETTFIVWGERLEGPTPKAAVSSSCRYVANVNTTSHFTDEGLCVLT